MDTRTVFADKLVLPRALKVLDRGVLVGEPPNLWLMRDTDGDLKADTKELVNDTYGRGEASIEHNANSLFWGLDNVIYTSEHDWHLRFRNGAFEIDADAQPRPVGRARMDDAGRIYRNVNDAPLFVDFVAGAVLRAEPEPRADARPLRSADLARGLDDLADPARRAASIAATAISSSGPTTARSRFRASARPSSIAAIGCPKELHGDAFITDSTTNLRALATRSWTTARPADGGRRLREGRDLRVVATSASGR